MQSEDRKRKTKKPIISPRLLCAVGIPPEVCDRLPVITVTGGRYASVEHHNGVLQLSRQCVRLYSDAGIIRIEGKDLSVSSMDNELIRLSGAVTSVKFE